MKRFFTIKPRLAIALSCLVFSTSCSELTALAYFDQIIRTEEKIQALIGDARCSEDRQCKVLYLESIESCRADIPVAFSDANNIEAELFELERERRNYIYQNLLVNGSGAICSPLPRFERTARCVSQRCSLQ
jgi:hypothetical protein